MNERVEASILYLNIAYLSSSICNINLTFLPGQLILAAFSIFIAFQLISDQIYLFHRCLVLAAKSL